MPESRFASWEEAVAALRNQPDRRELVEACFYDDPLENAAERYFCSSEWQAMTPLLPSPSGEALDIGAGRGISSYALARSGWTVAALEPDPSGLVGADAIRGLAVRSGLPISVTQNWGESLPFGTGRFDMVHCRQVLHHARDLPALCREVERVLKPGGTFIATREHVISKAADLERFLASHPLHHLYGGENAFSLPTYQSAITHSGLVMSKVFNPYASDINLYPVTRQQLRERIAGKLHWPAMARLPLSGWVLDLLGAWKQTPGRLYSFVAVKPGRATA